jgi:serine/threonine protein kinase
MWVTSLINFCFDQREQEISKLKSCHSEKDDLQRQLLEMKEQVTQLREEKALIEQKASTLTTELSQRIAELESKNETLQSEKQLLQEDQQLLQGQFTDCVKEKESLHKECQLLQESLAKCQEERQMFQEQLIKCQGEKQQLLTAQQESVAFGIEPWKVPHDKVELGGLIGGGGWGAVNEGKLKVAVKQFYPNILSETNIARLQREMRLLALIRHPNLLQFIAAAFDKGGNHRRNPPYIITELLDTSLRAAYEQKQLANKHQLPVFQDTARALDYLHQRYEPIIHRDVSSANVLLKRQPNGSWLAKVSDLGSANLAREAYTLNEGSLVYCAPEAFTDKSKTRSADTLTTKIDVFSFGVMLCEVVTAQFPDEDKFPSMLQRTRRLWPKIHPLIESCVDKDPDHRPSMADVLTTLQSIPSRRLINF